jgi:hypothetical protein
LPKQWLCSLHQRRSGRLHKAIIALLHMHMP